MSDRELRRYVTTYIFSFPFFFFFFFFFLFFLIFNKHERGHNLHKTARNKSSHCSYSLSRQAEQYPIFKYEEGGRRERERGTGKEMNIFFFFFFLR